MRFSRLLFAAALAPALFAQAPAAKAEFEVAAVKPSAQTGQNQAAVGVRIDGAQVHVSALPLIDYVRIAFRVRAYQVSGPDWISGERFDVDAKLPEGGKADLVPEMLRALLEDRFQMKIHREQKEFQVYALTAAGANKLKAAPLDAVAAGAAPVDVAAQGSASGVHINMGRGATFTILPDKLEARKVSMETLVDMLGRFLDRPVVDATGIAGTYDVEAPITQTDYQVMLVQSAVNSGVKLPPEALRVLQNGGGANESLANALRASGLKLEPRKMAIETIVVDSARRNPGEN